MSTTPVVPSPAPAGSKLQSILGIINIALQGITLAGSFTPVGAAITAGVKLEQVFQGLLSNALQLYQQETGQPINLLDIPLETPVA
jgi:ABC-type uncharacterized transport system permease subunit